RSAFVSLAGGRIRRPSGHCTRPFSPGRPNSAAAAMGSVLSWAWTDTGAIPKVKAPAISHCHTLPRPPGPAARLAPVRNRFIEASSPRCNLAGLVRTAVLAGTIVATLDSRSVGPRPRRDHADPVHREW